MPNWTSNLITVKGEKPEDIKAFLDAGIRNEDNELTLQSYIPIPESFLKYDTTNFPFGRNLKVGEKMYDTEEVITEELIEKYKTESQWQRDNYGIIGWYDWNRKYLGTKWDSELNFDMSEGCTSISCSNQTAWSAPVAFLVNVSKKFPNLTFEMLSHYEDGGNDVFVAIDGNLGSKDISEIQDAIEVAILEHIKDDPQYETDGNQITGRHWRKILQGCMNASPIFVTTGSGNSHISSVGSTTSSASKI